MENKRAEELIDRFFDGLTSNREEKELYAFFAQENIPGYLQKYQPVFAYFEKGIQTENQIDFTPEVFSQPKKKRIWIWTGIAASLLLVIGLRIFHPKDNLLFNPYEGSYIIRKGVKITDPEIIRPEIERSLYRVSMQEEISARLIDQFEYQELGTAYEQ
ncbi:MAG: hypothetical protein LBC48_01755 [Dysgonamonadaceae bacterium]|jgi:hypothetical protein|nr:hypothetical protein [Dysgonamonadaceae bacterium]